MSIDQIDKPTAEQIAWIFSLLLEHLEEPVSLRELIFNKMGLDHDAYQMMIAIGGLELCGALEVAYSAGAGGGHDDSDSGISSGLSDGDPSSSGSN
jgi:hypothetical protein